MSRTYKDMRIRVEGKQRELPDARRLARVLIEMAQAQAEADAQAANTGTKTKHENDHNPKPKDVRGRG